MALAFTRSDATDAVDHASGSTLDDVGPGTFLSWVYINDTTDSTNRVAAKGNNTKFVGGGDGANNVWGVNVLRTTSGCFAESVGNNFAAFGANKWLYFACTWDLAGANGDQRALMGDLTTRAAEPSAYDTQQVGSGTRNSDASDVWNTGNQDGQSRGFAGDIAWVALIGESLTNAQIQTIQWSPKEALKYDCRLFCHYGWNGTGTQPDWSGNGNNGTVEGTLTVVDHVPLGPPFGFDIPWQSVAASGGLSIPVAYHHQRMLTR